MADFLASRLSPVLPVFSPGYFAGIALSCAGCKITSWFVTVHVSIELHSAARASLIGQEVRVHHTCAYSRIFMPKHVWGHKGVFLSIHDLMTDEQYIIDDVISERCQDKMLTLVLTQPFCRRFG